MFQPAQERIQSPEWFWGAQASVECLLDGLIE
jgi:hypothetical protein